MGRNNRQRRAAKARQRHRPARPAGYAGGANPAPWSPPSASTTAERFLAAVYAEQAGDGLGVRRAIEHLGGGERSGVAGELETILERQLALAWDQGWQPADLDRVVGRALAGEAHGLLRGAVAAQADGYFELGSRVSPAWMAQVDGVLGSGRSTPARPYLAPTHRAGPERLLAAVRLMAFLLRLPDLPRLTDPPSAWNDADSPSGRSLPAGVLAKVRALLAKAESTTFDAEADALTAKAQELMARHRIDRAVLEASGQARGEEPEGRRLGVDDPYADAKAALLGGVADANGCRAVWSKSLGFSTVFGFAGELDAVEELFTSLLVQVTAALRREGSKQDRWGRSRTTRFRRSFLVAFAVRIGARLRETVDATVAAASVETGTALVPVLAARDAATEATFAATFPNIGSFSPAATDGEGWLAGTIFGDQADLALGPELTAPRR